jgi:hypothetical protein
MQMGTVIAQLYETMPSAKAIVLQGGARRARDFLEQDMRLRLERRGSSVFVFYSMASTSTKKPCKFGRRCDFLPVCRFSHPDGRAIDEKEIIETSPGQGARRRVHGRAVAAGEDVTLDKEDFTLEELMEEDKRNVGGEYSTTGFRWGCAEQRRIPACMQCGNDRPGACQTKHCGRHCTGPCSLHGN